VRKIKSGSQLFKSIGKSNLHYGLPGKRMVQHEIPNAEHGQSN